MCEITFLLDYAGLNYFVQSIKGELPKRLSMTKALGGKQLVSRSRSWTHHGCGGWITEYSVHTKAVNKVKQSLESYGIDSVWTAVEH